MNWLEFETAALEQGYNHICGVDEAGRGPLAGPVFAAAVILPDGYVIDGINDSKKLSEKKRELLFDVIKADAVDFCIASASVEEIEEINILQATFLAMTRAVEGLTKQPADLALIDGNGTPPMLKTPVQTIIKGDAKSANIAAASILAKVSRDRYMLTLDQLYPQYQFARHKGYGTKLHYEMLEAHGVSDVHRKSFLKKFFAQKVKA